MEKSHHLIPQNKKYWQTIFIRLCGVYKQATNPVYLSVRPRHHDLIILDFQLNIKFEAAEGYTHTPT